MGTLAFEKKKGHAVPAKAARVVGKARKVAMEAVAEGVRDTRATSHN